MSDPTITARCSLAVPAHVRMLPVVRLFVGSVARQWGAEESMVTDLRVGASELAGAAMRGEPGEVLIEVRRDQGSVVVSVSPVDRAALEAGDEPAADVVGGLFDDMSIGDGVVSISSGSGS